MLIFLLCWIFHGVVYAAAAEQYEACLSKASICTSTKDPSLDIFKTICESKRKELGCDELFKHASDEEKAKFYSCENPNSLCDHLTGVQWERSYECARGVGAVIVDSVEGVIYLPKTIWELVKKVPEIPGVIRSCQDDHDAKKAYLGAFRSADMAEETIRSMSCGDVQRFVRQKVQVQLQKLEQRRQEKMATTGIENLRYTDLQLSPAEIQALNFDTAHSGILRRMQCFRPEERARTACEELTKAVLGASGAGGGALGLPKLVRFLHGRAGQAEKLLGRELTAAQKQAVREAHEVGAGQVGRDGTLAGIDNYTDAQLAEKARLLKQAGFTVEERRQLIEAGIVGRARAVSEVAELKSGSTAVTPAGIQRLNKQYPRLAEMWEQVENKMTQNILDYRPGQPVNSAFVYKNKPIQNLAEMPDGFREARHFPKDSQVKKALVQTYNALNNPEEFSRYMKKLTYEAAAEMEKRGMQAKLKKGEIPDEVVKDILVRRFEERGLTVQDVHVTQPRAFQTRLQKGPFIDHINNADHGMYSHLIQLDYVHKHFSTATGGQPLRVYQYLGSESGSRIWERIFDTMAYDGYASKPELVQKYFRQLQKLEPQTVEFFSPTPK